MSTTIGNYKLNKPLSNKNAGCSKWGYGKKNKKEYFLKEFLTPVYPEDTIELSQATIDKKKKICKDFEEKEKNLIYAINKSSDGNILRIHEFFRYGTKYYIATEKLEPISEEMIFNLSFDEKIRILKVLAHSMSELHKNGIIHGDIKLSNLMFVKSKSGRITVKIIDIDGCFFEDDIPFCENLVIDPVYMSPEAFIYINMESGKVDTKTDVFAMGIIFHQILTGRMPDFDKTKYNYVYECILSGGELNLGFCEKKVNSIITDMLNVNPDERISMQQVFEKLVNLTSKEETIISDIPEQEEEQVICDDMEQENEQFINNSSKQEKIDDFFVRAGDL